MTAANMATTNCASAYYPVFNVYGVGSPPNPTYSWAIGPPSPSLYSPPTAYYAIAPAPPHLYPPLAPPTHSAPQEHPEPQKEQKKSKSKNVEGPDLIEDRATSEKPSSEKGESASASASNQAQTRSRSRSCRSSVPDRICIYIGAQPPDNPLPVAAETAETAAAEEAPPSPPPAPRRGRGHHRRQRSRSGQDQPHGKMSVFLPGIWHSFREVVAKTCVQMPLSQVDHCWSDVIRGRQRRKGCVSCHHYPSLFSAPVVMAREDIVRVSVTSADDSK